VAALQRDPVRYGKVLGRMGVGLHLSRPNMTTIIANYLLAGSVGFGRGVVADNHRGTESLRESGIKRQRGWAVVRSDDASER
jgi:hypothetical protein